MSTKTVLKRVALVAVASLAIGGVSAVSAFAANANLGVVAQAVGGAVTNGTTATGYAGPANSVTLGTSAGVVREYITISGGTFAGGSTTATLAANGVGTVVIPTPSVGTIVVSGYAETGSSTGIFSASVSDTVTITVTAVPAAPAFSATLSTETLGLTNALAPTPGTDVAVIVAQGTAQAANIALRLKLDNSTAYAGTDISAVATGPGLITSAAGLTPTGTGNSKVASVTLDGSGNAVIYVNGDGTAGSSTITVSKGATVLATKTVVFSGALSALTATTKTGIQADTAVAQTGAVLVTGADAAGNFVASVPLTVTSSNTAVIANYTTTSAATSSSGAAQGPTSIAGKFGSVVLTFKDTSTGLVVATATVVASSATAKTVSVKFDKATYAPGELVTITVGAVDANGLPVADGTSVASLVTGNLITTTALQGFTGALSGTTVSGSKSFTTYAPLVAGPLAISGTDLNAVAISASASVVADTSALDAANSAADIAAEALDAANAATDAATAAADAADAATSAAQDAVDAANAATDAANTAADTAANAETAANAATDAANAAADAADSATAAAQDAADAANAATDAANKAADQAGQALAAVNALATSVASLLASVKAQLTSLTNLVVKIQKKVQA